MTSVPLSSDLRFLSSRAIAAAVLVTATVVPMASHAVIASYEEGQLVLGTGASTVNMSLGTVDIMSTGFTTARSNCSGVALTDTLILTAAHCLYADRMVLDQSHGLFSLYRPGPYQSVGVAQGLVNPMTEQVSRFPITNEDAGFRSIAFNTSAGGLVDAAAWIPNNTGQPDLAILRIQGPVGQASAGLMPGPLLHRPGETLARMDPAQGAQERGQGESMVNATVGGYSGFDGNRRNQAGSVMPDPDMIDNSTLGIDRTWAGKVFFQEAAQVTRYAGDVRPGETIYHTERSTNVRLINGDSGGPLVARMTNGALRVVGIASVSGPLQLDSTPAKGPDGANWVAVEPYLPIIDSMIASLVALPAPGVTSRVPLLSRALLLDGIDYLASFEAVARFRSNFFYFSHVQGLSDRLLVSDRSVPIRGLDFGDHSLSGLVIRGRNAAGQLVPVGFTVGTGGVVTLTSPQTEIEFEGLDSLPGSALSLGVRFDTVGFGPVVQSLQWRSVGLASVVPEPSAAALLLAGLIGLGWWTRRLRD